MSSTTTAPSRTRYHRDAHGLEIEYLQDFDPSKAYIHYIEEWSPSQDDVIPNGATVSAFCGENSAPLATNYIGPDSPVRLVCPHCYHQTILRRMSTN